MVDLLEQAHDSARFSGLLRDTLAQALDDPGLELRGLHRAGDGLSWDTYVVSVDGAAGAQRFAVKRAPAAGLLSDEYDVVREADLLDTARAIGCPAPHTIALHSGENGERGFYAMSFVDGVVPVAWDVKKVFPDPKVRASLGLELARLMAQLHAADPASIKVKGMVLPASGAVTGLDEAAKWHRIYLHEAGTRLPIIDLAFAWLAHRADWVSGRIAFVHNDLRVGNFVVRDDRIVAVLDWETAALLDPAVDLAKFNLPWLRGRSTVASGLVEWTDFLTAYADAGGTVPEKRTLDYWSVLEMTKAIVAGLRGATLFRSGKTNDVRYANLGWQTHHSIKWLVEMFEANEWGR